MTGLLEIRGLRTDFELPGGRFPAIEDINLSLRAGEVVGLVGESGSGKSVLAFSILGLIDPPGRVVAGEVLFRDRDLRRFSGTELRSIRGNRIAMIFQDPMMTLNPVLRIGTQMIETIRAHRTMKADEASRIARDALGRVGIPSPEERLDAYPGQFSGGMRQRVAIAIALLNEPDLIIADEPTTALDVTIQAQILSIASDLRKTQKMAWLWITHDLSLLEGFADRLAVMYSGRIIEEGPFDGLIEAPRHPYLRGLIESLPSRNRRGERLFQIPGSTPDLTGRSSGCAFRPRCELATDACLAVPTLRKTGQRSVACAHPLNAGASHEA